LNKVVVGAGTIAYRGRVGCAGREMMAPVCAG